MTKVCLIGNSHVGALVTAWESEANRYPHIKADYYALKSSRLLNVSAGIGGTLVSPQPMYSHTAEEGQGKTDTIDVSAYDAAVLVGCVFGPASVLRVYIDHHYPGLSSRQGEELTREQFRQAVRQRIRKTAIQHLQTLIQKASPMPLFVVPVPLPSESGFEAVDTPIMQSYRAARQNGDGEQLMTLYKVVCEELRLEGLRVIQQPDDTMFSPLSTLSSFAENSVRMRRQHKQHDVEDIFHMNSEYGAIMWREIAAALAQL